MTPGDAVAVLVLVLMAALGAGLLWRGLPELRVAPPEAPPSARQGAAPRISVIVPARDEEQSLPALLGALRAAAVGEGPVVHEVLVVDDASRDATARVAAEGGARVVTASPLPAGWTGKAWACHLGAQASAGDLLLFLDADTVLEPGALASLAALQHRHGGLVSVQPHHEARRAHEQLSAYFNVVALMASSSFSQSRTRRPMAFGPCLLTSREDYGRAGGHAAVRGEVLDDIRLAAAYRRAGMAVTTTRGGAAVRMRSYPLGLRQLASGWTKNIASGAGAAPVLSTAVTAGWVATHHAVVVGAGGAVVASGLLGPAHRPPAGALPWSAELAVWAVAYVGLAWQLRHLLARSGSFRWWAWAAFPVALVVFDLLFARSLTHTILRRSVRWRGRDVDLRVDSSPQGAGS